VLSLFIFLILPLHALKNAPTAKQAEPVPTGSLVIAPQFESAGPFSEGLAAVQVGADKGWKWGYIDKSGALVIAPQFDVADAFSEGLAAVRVGDDKTGQWGFVDRTGNFVIRPQWDHASAFSNGLAVVRTGNPSPVYGKEKVIDRQGRYVSDLNAGVVLPCGNGLTMVGINVSWPAGGVNRHFGFIDKLGEFVIKPAFDDAFCFTEGVAAVRVGNAETGKWGFIDMTGAFVLDPQWGFAYPFKDGVATVALAGSGGRKWGAIDSTGQEIIPLRFPEPLSFAEGFAIVSRTTYRWVSGTDGTTKLRPDTSYFFIDRTGSQPNQNQWRGAAAFSNGVAPVMVGDSPTAKWGYVDALGRFVMAPQFENARPFSEGMAAVLVRDRTTEKWGYIAR
jgi:hypothetical protein